MSSSSIETVKGSMTSKQSEAQPVHPALQHFDKLPDSATARAPVVAALFSVSIPTVWRWTRDKRLPAPTKRGGVTTWSVGALRLILAGSDDAGVVPRTATATAAATAKRTRTAPTV